MATFPTGIVSLTNPTSTTKMNVVSHAGQHILANDEIEAIETALGASLANVVLTSTVSTDGTLVTNSDALLPTEKAVKTYADAISLSGGGIPIGYLSTDGTMAANSDIKVPTEKALVTYVTAQAVLLSTIYPVGCIYTTTVATNPGTVFGFGTWAAFGSGRCLVGVDTLQTEFDVVEETGGAKTHVLTTAEMPAHTHNYVISNYTNANSSTGFFAASSTQGPTSSTGGGGAHNNLQPYITVYFFKRTA